MMSRRERRSGGRPCGWGGSIGSVEYEVAAALLLMAEDEEGMREECTGTRPRFEARMTSGESGASRARVREVKVSRSSMWTYG